jgi:hypothetical protein
MNDKEEKIIKCQFLKNFKKWEPLIENNFENEILCDETLEELFNKIKDLN